MRTDERAVFDLDRSDAARLDAIHAFLSRSFWAEGIPRRSSRSRSPIRCASGCSTARSQVGFARVVTDRATFAYLCDVYVLESHRGTRAWQMADRGGHGASRSAGTAAVSTRHPRRARTVQRHGFDAPADPERHMEIFRHGMYLGKELIMAVKPIPDGLPHGSTVSDGQRRQRICSNSSKKVFDATRNREHVRSRRRHGHARRSEDRRLDRHDCRCAGPVAADAGRFVRVCSRRGRDLQEGGGRRRTPR